ncbi:MAG TPA: hypothetical protein VF265_04885 [Nevskiaceae bacterium]
MHDANARYEAQDLAGAKQLYRQAAGLDPRAAEPWSRLARIDFDRQNYGYTVVYAHEALQRDPADAAMQSMLTVSGLRIAVDVLGRLRDEMSQDGSAHLEAQKLAATMREVLGPNVFQPPAASRKARRVVRRRASKPAVPADGALPASAPAPVLSNPFEALPGADG